MMRLFVCCHSSLNDKQHTTATQLTTHSPAVDNQQPNNSNQQQRPCKGSLASVKAFFSPSKSNLYSTHPSRQTTTASRISNTTSCNNQQHQHQHSTSLHSHSHSMYTQHCSPPFISLTKSFVRLLQHQHHQQTASASSSEELKFASIPSIQVAANSTDAETEEKAEPETRTNSQSEAAAPSAVGVVDVVNSNLNSNFTLVSYHSNSTSTSTSFPHSSPSSDLPVQPATHANPALATHNQTSTQSPNNQTQQQQQQQTSHQASAPSSSTSRLDLLLRELPPRQTFPLDRFKKIRTLRSTLFGKVVLYIDTLYQRPVAIKQSNKALIEAGKTTTGSRVSENPLEEIRTMNILSGAIPTIDYKRMNLEMRLLQTFVLTSLGEYEDDSNIFTVMEFCSKGEMFDVVCNETRFAESKALYYFVQMVLALHYMHSFHMCHLDVSLENLMLTQDNHIKLIDFGLTRRVKYTKDGQECLFAGATSNRPGKLGYMANEVFEGRTFSGYAADCYSMGVVLFISLFGVPPYSVPNLSDQRFALIFTGRIKDLLKAWNMSAIASDLALDLISRLICPPENRLTIPQILAHPWCRQQVEVQLQQLHQQHQMQLVTQLLQQRQRANQTDLLLIPSTFSQQLPPFHDLNVQQHATTSATNPTTSVIPTIPHTRNVSTSPSHSLNPQSESMPNSQSRPSLETTTKHTTNLQLNSMMQ